MNTYTADMYIAKRDSNDKNRWGVVNVSTPSKWAVDPSMTFIDASRKAMSMNSSASLVTPTRFSHR